MPELSTDMQRSRGADDLRAAFKREGCPVCTVMLEYVEQSMDRWEYEGFSDVEHRHQLIRSRGFCPLHTWQLARRSNAFRLGLIYTEVLTDVLLELDAVYSRFSSTKVRPPKRESAWKRWWRSRRHQTDVRPAFEQCPFCYNRASTEERLISTLVQALASEEICVLHAQSTGLCLAHFTQAFQFAQKQQSVTISYLLACQRTCTRRTLEDVRELVRKHDYRFSNESHGGEMTSWRRAEHEDTLKRPANMLIEAQVRQPCRDCPILTWDHEHGRFGAVDIYRAEAGLPADLASFQLEGRLEAPILLLNTTSFPPGTFAQARLLGALSLNRSDQREHPYPTDAWLFVAAAEVDSLFSRYQSLQELPPSKLNALKAYAQSRSQELQQQGNDAVQVCNADSAARFIRETRLLLKREQRARPKGKHRPGRQEEEKPVAWRAVEGLAEALRLRLQYDAMLQQDKNAPHAQSI